MASNNKPKNQEKTIYVYDMTSNFPTKNPISRGWGSAFLTRSKTYNGGRKMVAAEEEDRAEPKVVVESRKSVSSLSTSSKMSRLMEGRRSSVSQVDGNVGSVASLLQVKVLVSDMPGFMQVHAFRCARTTYDSLDKFSLKHMAYHMKKEFDKEYGPAWHCIVGSSFGSFVTHSTGCFLYFSMEKLYILVFKTKVQRADDLHYS